MHTAGEVDIYSRFYLNYFDLLYALIMQIDFQLLFLAEPFQSAFKWISKEVAYDEEFFLIFKHIFINCLRKFPR